MKVIIISHHLKGNDGWSRYARDLVLNLDNIGAEILCLVNEVDDNTAVKQIPLLKKGPLSYIGNIFLAWLNSRKINKEIRRFKPDIVHIIVEPYGTMVPFIRKGKSKLILTVHSTFAFLPILVKGLKRILLNLVTLLSCRKIDVFISVSKYTENYFVQCMKKIGGDSLVRNKLIIISGGVSSEMIASGARNFSKGDLKKILFVGAIKPRKGLMESINALSKVKSNFIFKIVGAYDKENPYVKLLKEKIVEYGLESKVVFCGQVTDIELRKMYAEADLFLMLSINNGVDFEGYGLVYLEANAKGVPVIGPNDSGVSDAICDGKTGYIVNQFDPNGVADLIDRVLTDNPINAEDCLSWARENTSENKALKVMEMYKRVVG